MAKLTKTNITNAKAASGSSKGRVILNSQLSDRCENDWFRFSPLVEFAQSQPLDQNSASRAANDFGERCLRAKTRSSREFFNDGFAAAHVIEAGRVGF